MDCRIKDCLKRAFSILKPKPEMNPADWANEFLYVPQGESRFPGKFSTQLMPYQYEMLAVVGEKAIHKVTYMLASQCSKTQTLLALALYYTHWIPSSVGLYFSNKDHLEEFSKDRLQATIDCSPALKPLVKKNTTKNSGNTIRHKRSSNGAIIRLKNANVGNSFRGPSMRLVCMDEVDNLKYDIQGEGDPLQQGQTRTTVWGDLAKFVVSSTPTIKDASLTEASFQDSDQRFYYVPCPHCGEKQTLNMSTVVDGEPYYWFKIPEDDPRQACFECKECHCLIDEQHKGFMLANGEWRKHNPRAVDHAGFSLSTFYSPLFSWQRMASEWQDANRKGRTAMKAYVNTRLAETWADYDTSKLNQDSLSSKREQYSAFIPHGVAYLTAFADVQKDRIEVSLYGHGLKEQSWLIRHYIMFGATDTSFTEPFKLLDKMLATEYEHESGQKLKILCAFVDSGEGGKTQVVYEFCRPRLKRGVFASKGSSGYIKGSLKKSVDAKHDTHINVDVNSLKDKILGLLAITDKREAGYIHLPLDRIVYIYQEDGLIEFWNQDGTSYDNQFLDQFLSEYKKPNGRWETKPGQKRNEALDCLVGSLGAFMYASREKWAGVNVQGKLNALNVPQEEGQKPKPPMATPEPSAAPETIRGLPWGTESPRPRVDLNSLLDTFNPRSY